MDITEAPAFVERTTRLVERVAKLAEQLGYATKQIRVKLNRLPHQGVVYAPGLIFQAEQPKFILEPCGINRPCKAVKELGNDGRALLGVMPEGPRAGFICHGKKWAIRRHGAPDSAPLLSLTKRNLKLILDDLTRISLT